MNQLDVAALEGVLECDRCWQAVILRPKVDGCKEEDCNLLDEKPQPFRTTKCAGKKSELSSHSRQQVTLMVFGFRRNSPLFLESGAMSKHRLADGHGRDACMIRPP
jgi:hypothetical protein